MEVRWLGHSCFKLTHQGHSVVIDPYQPGSVPGLRDIQETADMVLCSHAHFDHNYADGVAIGPDAKPAFFDVTAINVCHDDKDGTLRGLSDIYLIEVDGWRIAHFGDIGCALTADQKIMLQNLDLALIPVGGYYTIDGLQAAELVKELSPRTVIPMHYTGDTYGFDEIARVETFTALFDENDIRYETGPAVVLEKPMDRQIIVLSYV